MARAARKKGGDTNGDAGGGQAEAESVTGYFKRILRDNRRLLRTRSNAELIQRWQDDHPGQAVTEKVKTGLANAKSSLRQKRRGRKRRRQEAQEATPPTAAGRPPGRRPGGHRLEPLEEQIDECLGLAKTLDREGLESVIKLLHRARNEVVWKLGE
jgi:hypothetical protein